MIFYKTVAMRKKIVRRLHTVTTRLEISLVACPGKTRNQHQSSTHVSHPLGRFSRSGHTHFFRIPERTLRRDWGIGVSRRCS